MHQVLKPYWKRAIAERSMMKITCRESVYSSIKADEVLFIAGHIYDALILPLMIVTYNEQDRRHILFDRDHPEGWRWFQEHFE